MTERLIEKFDRLAAEAGIKDVTPEIRRFAVLVRQDLVGWPGHEGVDLTAAEPDMRDKREANKENTMTEEELKSKMLAFIDTQDGDYADEWYASPRDFAATILTDFSEYLGLELVVPEHVPQLKKPEIDRNSMLQSLMPEINRLFDIEFKKNLKEQS